MRAEVLICGASFAGLAVARELAATGASVLVIDRYEIGERQTSACACPTLWLDALGLGESIKQELPYMSFTTPSSSVRYRLPWSWSSFDYRKLCKLLWAQCGDARFETAKVESLGEQDADGTIAVVTDRGTISAPLVVDALGWRRVLSSRPCRAGWRFTRITTAPATRSTFGSSAGSSVVAMAGACRQGTKHASESVRMTPSSM